MNRMDENKRDRAKQEYLRLKRSLERYGIERGFEESDIAGQAPEEIVRQEIRIMKAHLSGLEKIEAADDTAE